MRKPIVPTLSIIARGNTLRSPRDETRKESIRITKTVGAIVLLFVILMLPLQIAMFASVICKVVSPWVGLLWTYGDVLATVNSCLDPFVYSARTKRYREQIIKSITCLCPWYKRKRHAKSQCSRSERVFPTRNENMSYTNDNILRTVDEITIDFPENKSTLCELSFPVKNGNAKETDCYTCL
jgi:hypothetical protein